MELTDHPTDAERYIVERVCQYRDWYNKKSVSMKRCYLRMRAFSVVAGSIVPVLINVDPRVSVTFFALKIAPMQALVTVISILVVASVSLESVLHCREQWKNYRSTEQMLGHELVFFRNRVGRYRDLTDADAFRAFVERIEDMIRAENAATLNVMTMVGDAESKNRSGSLP